MSKQIKTTIKWTVIFFVILAIWKYLAGVDNWLEETLNWAIPIGAGFFFGYEIARRDYED